MTQPRRWPNYAETYRSQTIHDARTGRVLCQRLRLYIPNQDGKLILAELLSLLLQIELNMTKAREGIADVESITDY